ncbi:MAG: hypothetical protein EBR94_11360 [Bacteroidetes bacterium]|nr:hypothetical protein [Bacteroidota bacterium]
MSDYILFPNDAYPDTSPEANVVGNYLVSIALGTHPSIVAGEKAYQDALCASGYFCCGACDCYAPDTPPFCGTNWIPCDPKPGCKPWWSPPWTLEPCEVDPIAKVAEETLRAINEAHEKAVGYEARIKLAGNRALVLSNERLSSIFYNDMLTSAESILIGMVNTFLQAGAIAGAVAGATQVFSATMGIYASQANAFLKSFQPYNPPRIGGGGGLA